MYDTCRITRTDHQLTADIAIDVTGHIELLFQGHSEGIPTSQAP